MRQRRLHFGKIIARVFVAALLISRLAHPRSAQASDFESAAEPSILREYLRAHKGASIQREPLGELKGPGGTTAKFVAIVASDPRAPSSGAKGIVVGLRSRSPEAVIYLDDDVIVVNETERRDRLKEFYDALCRLAADGENVSAPPRTRAPLDAEEAGMTNRADPSQPTPRGTVFVVGWFRGESEDEVAFESPWAGSAWYRFPGAHPTQVRDIIAKGRRFLASH